MISAKRSINRLPNQNVNSFTMIRIADQVRRLADERRDRAKAQSDDQR
jgi:hypothetical protein